MKAFAIYTLIVVGLAYVGVISEPTSDGVIGVLMFTPVGIWAIMILVRGARWGKDTSQRIAP